MTETIVLGMLVAWLALTLVMTLGAGRARRERVETKTQAKAQTKASAVVVDSLDAFDARRESDRRDAALASRP